MFEVKSCYSLIGQLESLGFRRLIGLKTLWKAIVLVVLFSITTVFTAYTVSAHHVASHIFEFDGILMWSSRPSGTFFPWPSYPLGIIRVPMIIAVNEVDALYYQLFIKSWVLVGITVLLWTVTVAFCITSILRTKKQNVK